MMHLKRTYFVAALALMLVAGVTLGAMAGGRTERAPQVAAPTAPVLPVQMPLNTGSFAGVAEAIKPAVININTVSKGGGLGGGRTPFEEFFGEDFFKRFFGDTPEPRLRCGIRSGASPKKRLKKSSPKNSSNGVRPPGPPLETVLMLMTAGLMASATPAKLPVLSGICTGSTGAVGAVTCGGRSVRPAATAPSVTPATSISASAATK